MNIFILVPHAKTKGVEFMNKTILAIILLLGFISSFNIQISHGMSPSKHMTMQKAKQIALEQVIGEIVDSRIEKDNGMINYKYVIQTKDGWHEVEIEKATGKVLEVDQEGSNRD